jgi:hypothetical protein
MKDGSVTGLRERFVSGFWLSVPFSLLLLAAASVSDAMNNAWLFAMAIFIIATLPGSIILLVLGAIALFSGSSGVPYVWICIAPAIVNAHFMGMLYSYLLNRFWLKRL